MENNPQLKCPKCAKDMRYIYGYPQCITCGYEDYTTKVVRESINLPEALRANLYLAHYRGATPIHKDVVVRIRIQDKLKGAVESEPKLIPECPKCQGNMTWNKDKDRLFPNATSKWYECNKKKSHIIFLNFEKLYWSDTYGY